MRPILTAILILSLTGCSSAVKQDETLLFFPTNGQFDEQEQRWDVPVRGWVFEPERDSVKRRYALDKLVEKLGLEPGTAEDSLFRQRAAMFLVDNERSKRIIVRTGSVSKEIGPSGANGHFSGNLFLTDADAQRRFGGAWMDFHAVISESDSRQFEGRSQLLGSNGISVISDIDDTIKFSDVLNKKALLINTFLKPFVPVAGMADAYRRGASQGAAFHYVSSSPWQLYPALREFIDSEGFPAGSVSLRNFRLTDSSLLEFLTASEQYKLDTIRGLLNRYPDRRFILVGDSGERDPEIYGVVAREFPRQVLRVYIRDIHRGHDEDLRMRDALRGVPEERWMLFSNPENLAFRQP